MVRYLCTFTRIIKYMLKFKSKPWITLDLTKINICVKQIIQLLILLIRRTLDHEATGTQNCKSSPCFKEIFKIRL